MVRPTSNVSKHLYDALSGLVCSLYTVDDATPSQLPADNLFSNILNNPRRVLHKFLPRTKLIIPTILDLVVTHSLTNCQDRPTAINRLLFKVSDYNLNEAV